jgi:hypothetical protein
MIDQTHTMYTRLRRAQSDSHQDFGYASASVYGTEPDIRVRDFMQRLDKPKIF